MDVADMKAVSGAPEGAAVVADDQTAGRGRFDRKWVVEKGAAIAVSVILRPPPPVTARLHIVCSLAVARAIETATGLKPRIKWPNDVLLDGKKTSGILLTSSRDRKRQDLRQRRHRHKRQPDPRVPCSYFSARHQPAGPTGPARLPNSDPLRPILAPGKALFGSPLGLGHVGLVALLPRNPRPARSCTMAQGGHGRFRRARSRRGRG